MIETVTPESVGMSSARLARVDAWLERQVAQERLAGASVLIGRRGQPAYFNCAGRADIENGKAFDDETIVRIFSMTKAVTTVAAMMLYEEGAFQLDDPIARYLPEFRDTRVWTGGDADATETMPMETPITVHHLMTHTSGLTYGFMRTNPVDRMYRHQGMEFPGGADTLAGLVERLAQIPLICQPGTEWNYSVSIDVLGRLVEVWSGMSLQAFFTERLFKPLRMTDTGFHVREANHHRLAALYAPLSGGDMSTVAAGVVDQFAEKPTGLKLEEAAASSRYLQPATLFAGGGGLTATISDYGRFAQMLLNGGVLDGARLLSRKTVEYMRLNHLPDNRDMAAMGQPVWSETSYEGIGFGLGFAVVIDPVTAKVVTSKGEHHWGGAASTFFWIDPQEDLYTVLFTQLVPSSTYPIRRELRSAVYQTLID